MQGSALLLSKIKPAVVQTVTFYKLPKGGGASGGSPVIVHAYLLSKVKPAVVQTITFYKLPKGGSASGGSPEV